MIKRMLVCALIIVLSAIISSCSKKNEATPQISYSAGISYEADYGTSYNRAYGEKAYTEDMSKQTDAGEDNTRIIKTGTIDMETSEFDETTAFATELARSVGGYAESSNQYYYNRQLGLRNVYYTLRVPSESFSSVMEQLSSQDGVTSASVSEADVTDQYYDITTRLAAKESEEQRLLELISQAKELSDLILLEQRLSSVRTDIELYKSRQTGIDRKASYSTIRLNVSEVQDIYKADTLWERITKAFADSVDGVVRFFQSALVFIVSAAIPLLLFCVILYIGLRVFRRLSRRKESRNKAARSKKSIDSGARKVVKSLVEDVENDKREQ